MQDLLETIQAAVAADAAAEVRAAGAQACRQLLAALDPAPDPVQPAIPPVASIVAALRGLPADQLLGLAIAKLRAALPAGTEIAPVKPFNSQLVPVRLGG